MTAEDASNISFKVTCPGLDKHDFDIAHSGVTRLTDNPAVDFPYAWSPDGARIAFGSLRDGNLEIYVMNADGSAVKRLTDDPAMDIAPAWSPDGSRIAFVSERDGNRDIFIMNADGSQPVNLTVRPLRDGFPVWSPDGTRIAFVSERDNNSEVYVMDMIYSYLTRVAATAHADVWPRLVAGRQPHRLDLWREVLRPSRQRLSMAHVPPATPPVGDRGDPEFHQGIGLSHRAAGALRATSRRGRKRKARAVSFISQLALPLITAQSRLLLHAPEGFVPG